MTIFYQDELGVVSVEVNYCGIAFDQDNQNILFEDIDYKEYIVPISAIIEIMPYTTRN